MKALSPGMLIVFGSLLIAIRLCGAAPPQNQSMVIVSCDLNCIVGIDGKVVGRFQVGRQAPLSVAVGNHTMSAATAEGDYWEQQFDVSSGSTAPIAIPLQKARTERLALEAKKAELQIHVQQTQAQLASIKQQNEVLVRNPELIRAERRLIVEAVNYYADRYGKELGLQDTHAVTSTQLGQSGIIDSLSPNTGTQVGSIIENLLSLREEAKAKRNGIAVAAASTRMQELAEAMKDPLKRVRSSDETSYLVVVRQVLYKKRPGELITAPDRVEYRDNASDFRLSCDEIHGLGGGKHLGFHFPVPNQTGKSKKKQKRVSLSLKAVNSDQGSLIGDMYLACPKFTQ